MRASYSEFIQYKNSTNSQINYLEYESSYDCFLDNDGFSLKTEIKKTDPKNEDQIDFEDNYKIGANLPSSRTKSIAPFASKNLVDGKKLFNRVHGFGRLCPSNETTNIDFTIPYNVAKFSGADVIGCNHGDILNFVVLDTLDNYISGLDPSFFGGNFQLNQFGFDVFLPDGTYSSKSNYDADVYSGMILRCQYTNNSSIERLIGINVKLHEVK